MKKIMIYAASLLIMLTSVIALMKPVSAEAPRNNVKTNVCGVPAYNTKYVKYDDQFTIQKQSYKQFEKTQFFDRTATYYTVSSFKNPKRDYVVNAIRCFMFIMNKHGENNLFGNQLQINLVNTSVNEYNSGFYVWGETFDKSGNHAIDLYRSGIYNNKQYVYETVFHELGHLIDAYYISDKEMDQYRKLRGLENGYVNSSKEMGVNRSHDVSELFANDVAKSLIPSSLWPKQLDSRSTLKTIQDVQQFRNFLFNAIKNN